MQTRTLSFEDYLNKIRPYLKDIINDLKESGTWQIQLTIATNFMSSRDNDKECLIMHLKSHNKEIAIDDKTDEV